MAVGFDHTQKIRVYGDRGHPAAPSSTLARWTRRKPRRPTTTAQERPHPSIVEAVGASGGRGWWEGGGFPGPVSSAYGRSRRRSYRGAPESDSGMRLSVVPG